jgi:hypothetical protein
MLKIPIFQTECECITRQKMVGGLGQGEPVEVFRFGIYTSAG